MAHLLSLELDNGDVRCRRRPGMRGSAGKVKEVFWK